MAAEEVAEGFQNVLLLFDNYDVSDELLHENSEFKLYLKQLSEAKGDFSEETIRKFSAAFEKAGVQVGRGNYCNYGVRRAIKGYQKTDQKG